MKITGIILTWVGIVAFLRSMGFIEVIDWSIVWPVALIVVGIILKKYKRCTSCNNSLCMIGGCAKADGHKCEGADCGVCK